MSHHGKHVKDPHEHGETPDDRPAEHGERRENPHAEHTERSLYTHDGGQVGGGTGSTHDGGVLGGAGREGDVDGSGPPDAPVHRDTYDDGTHVTRDGA